MTKTLAFFLAVACTWGAAQAQSQFSFTTLAGLAGATVNSLDGIGSAAQFSSPRGIAVDSAGTVYVADSSNHTIRRVSPSGAVTTLAGTPGAAGVAGASQVRFSEPFGVAVDNSGTVFVADTNNNAIRKITAAGVVSTLAGGSGMGSNDGTGAAAKFSEPHALALDANGNLFVSDYMNGTIRKVTPAGVVTTVAGSAGFTGFTDGQGAAARFRSPQGITADTAGNLYVADAGNRSIRKISASGLVTTLVDGSNGQFGAPRGVAVDVSGNLYVTDFSANTIHKVTAAGVVSTIAGTPPLAGSTDGPSTAALFDGPSAVAVDSANNLYVADTANNTVRKIAPTNAVTTLAGLAGRSSSVDGTGVQARFEDPYAVATDNAGNVYVADAKDHSIRKIAPDGRVTTLAGKAGAFGGSDGMGTSARFKTPRGIAVDTAGNVFVADTGNSTVRKISAAGAVTTLAGTAGARGSTDATGAAARFSSPYGVAVDTNGNVYVVESDMATLRKISPAGTVTTLAGSPSNIGFVDGTGAAARFSVPFDVAVDAAGNVYICDHGNHAIRKVSPAGIVTTLAGSGAPGKADANGRLASFKFPAGIAVDSAGNVFVADTDNQAIRRISPAGDVTTVAGSGTIGSTDDIGTAATFYNPKDVAVDAGGTLYVADEANHTIRKGTVQSVDSTSTARCVFSWAERSFPQYFAPTGAGDQTTGPYFFRYYSATGNYLATNATDGHLLALGVATAGKLLDLGLLTDYRAAAGCQ